jgi:DNA polymerase-1
MLLRIEREWRPTHLCVIYDAPGPTFRDEIFAAYKANRPPMPADLAAQIGLSHRVVEAFGLPVLSVPGVEADDTIATLARQAVAAGLQVVICSSDKDLMQLCSDRIQLLDTMKNKLLGPAEVQEKFGVAPERLGDSAGPDGRQRGQRARRRRHRAQDRGRSHQPVWLARWRA